METMHMPFWWLAKKNVFVQFYEMQVKVDIFPERIIFLLINLLVHLFDSSSFIFGSLLFECFFTWEFYITY